MGDLIVRGDLEAYSCERSAPSASCALPPCHRPTHARVPTFTPRPRPPPPAGKLAGLDKKLSRSLEEEVAATTTSAASSPAGGAAATLGLSKSPVGPLHETSSRRTLVYLILTLNHIYPDYDFSLLRAHHFRKEEGLGGIEETIDAHLVEASKVGGWVPLPGCRAVGRGCGAVGGAAGGLWGARWNGCLCADVVES